MRMRRIFFFLHLSLQKYKRKFSIRTGNFFLNFFFENVANDFDRIIITQIQITTEESKRNRPFFVRVVKRLREMC